MKKAFLGGTCNESNWRNKLIKLLVIDYFNPVVENQDNKAKENELFERVNCDFVLYVITPKMKGVYSIAESVEDAIKRPNHTLFCLLENDEGFVFDKFQINSLREVSNMIERNGAKTFNTLEDVANYLNTQ